MKYTAVIFASAMLFAAAVADPDPYICWRKGMSCRKVKRSADPDPYICWRKGMSCRKLKRAVEVATTILDEPTTDHVKRAACFADGQPCAKAKRAEDALRESLKYADLENYAEGSTQPTSTFCEDGQPCPRRVKLVARSIGSEVEAKDDENADHEFCHGEGQQCNKVKRAAEALAEALAEPEAEAESDAKKDFCKRKNQPCHKANRAIEHLNQAAKDALLYVTEDTPGPNY